MSAIDSLNNQVALNSQLAQWGHTIVFWILLDCCSLKAAYLEVRTTSNVVVDMKGQKLPGAVTGFEAHFKNVTLPGLWTSNKTFVSTISVAFGNTKIAKYIWTKTC